MARGIRYKTPVSDRQHLLTLIAGYSVGVDRDPPLPIAIGYSSAFYLLQALEDAGYQFTRTKRHGRTQRDAK